MPQDTLDYPPFPALKWEHFFWVGDIVLPSWAGFQARRGAYSAVSSRKESDGTARLSKRGKGVRFICWRVIIEPDPFLPDPFSALVTRPESRPQEAQLPARNIHHTAVIQALKDDGWTITHDPLLIRFGDRRLFIDLGAERGTIGAVRGSERIAVEIASFVADSPVRDLQEAIGQFVVYRTLLSQEEPERSLFLGVSTRVYDSILSEPLGQLVAAEVRLRVLVFDPHEQKVVRWIN